MAASRVLVSLWTFVVGVSSLARPLGSPKKILVAPSVAEANFLNLGSELKSALKGGADWLHFSVQDGRMVPKLSFGAPIVGACRELFPETVFNVRLGCIEPEHCIEEFVRAGADIISVHPEATVRLGAVLNKIDQAGVAPGVVLNPGTPVSAVEHVLHQCQVAEVMLVDPGCKEPKYIHQAVEKIRRLRQLKPEIHISVEGGVSEEDDNLLINAGANVIVAGVGIFKSPNKKAVIDYLKNKTPPPDVTVEISDGETVTVHSNEGAKSQFFATVNGVRDDSKVSSNGAEKKSYREPYIYGGFKHRNQAAADTEGQETSSFSNEVNGVFNQKVGETDVKGDFNGEVNGVFKRNVGDSSKGHVHGEFNGEANDKKVNGEFDGEVNANGGFVGTVNSDFFNFSVNTANGKKVNGEVNGKAHGQANGQANGKAKDTSHGGVKVGPDGGFNREVHTSAKGASSSGFNGHVSNDVHQHVGSSSHRHVHANGWTTNGYDTSGHARVHVNGFKTNGFDTRVHTAKKKVYSHFKVNTNDVIGGEREFGATSRGGINNHRQQARAQTTNNVKVNEGPSYFNEVLEKIRKIRELKTDPFISVDTDSVSQPEPNPFEDVEVAAAEAEIFDGPDEEIRTKKTKHKRSSPPPRSFDGDFSEIENNMWFATEKKIDVTGIDNLYLPSYLHGLWQVTQTLVSASKPGGLFQSIGGINGQESAARKYVAQTQRQRLGVPVQLQLRYLKTKWGVAEDRLFNTQQRLNAFAGKPVVEEVQYGNVRTSNREAILANGGTRSDPLQTTVVRFKKAATQKTFVLSHECLPSKDDGSWSGCELQRSIFSMKNDHTMTNPITTDSELLWEFLPLNKNHVKAKLRVADYLNTGDDEQFSETGHFAISYQDYILDMKRLGP